MQKPHEAMGAVGAILSLDITGMQIHPNVMLNARLNNGWGWGMRTGSGDGEWGWGGRGWGMGM